LQYRFAVPNGMYSIRLKFAEIFFSSAGRRVFNIALNGQTMESGFDIVAAAGGAFRAIDRAFTVSATSGQIAIDLVSVVENPKINAIEITNGTASSVAITLSPPSVTLNGGQQQQFTAVVTGSINTAVRWSLNPPAGSISASGLYTAPSTIAADQTVVLTAAADADPSKTVTATIYLRAPTGSFTPIRVNAGGSAYTDPLGQVWSADTGFLNGSTYTTASPVGNTTASSLYQNTRYQWGSTLQYRFSVPNGVYTVRLKFAEIYYTAAGQRVFNIVLNGQTRETNFDAVVAAGGPLRAVDRVFTVSATGAQIAIDLTPVIENPQLNAIEITTGPAAFTPIRLNAGGQAYTDGAGQLWSADTGFIGGSTYGTGAPIANTSTPLLYQSERYQSGTALQYRFSVPNGSYTVRLKFAEIWFSSTGQRVFNIALNGQVLTPNFDVVSAAGGPLRAVDRDYAVSVNNGQIAIDLIPVVSNPKISAIEITGL
jgi:hypothetical protein